jgi:hypothetical protein
MLARRDDYLRFAHNLRVPFDNNEAEQVIRMSKLRIKVSGCMRSMAGAEAFCAIRSYTATAARHGIGARRPLPRRPGKPLDPRAVLTAEPCPKPDTRRAPGITKIPVDLSSYALRNDHCLRPSRQSRLDMALVMAGLAGFPPCTEHAILRSLWRTERLFLAAIMPVICPSVPSRRARATTPAPGSKAEQARRR